MKKKRKIKIRRAWKLKPVTKVKASAKVYRRQAAKKSFSREIQDEV